VYSSGCHRLNQLQYENLVEISINKGVFDKCVLYKCTTLTSLKLRVYYGRNLLYVSAVVINQPMVLY